METLRRVLVFVAKDRSSPQKTGPSRVRTRTKPELNRPCPPQRPSFCPIKHLSITEAAAIPLDVRQRGVDVGVAILLQSSDQRLLLTRRAKHLRIFPNVWVPPGGHIEPDETVLEAGLRELKEETGLHLEQDQVHTRILGLWESVFPAMLSRGLPQRHHIVVYILLMTPRDHQQLQEDLSPSALEVSACLWAEPRLIRAALSKEDYSKDSVSPGLDLIQSCSVLFSPGSGVSIPVSVFKTSAPDHGPDLERISTGTKYALRLWLQDLTGPETGLDLNPDWS
uniref:m7GpppN-mRNA hydrolase NUDT17 n=1 Tax=Periophthalmus magnuspinnatus TaxID=409849 RepID=A0A3B4AT42_9GOBI